MQIKINNNVFNLVEQKVPFGPVKIEWDYDFLIQNVYQSYFEIRIGTTTTNIGTSSFIGDVISTGNIEGKINYYFVLSKFIKENTVYNCQIRLKDNLGNYTSWYFFQFSRNIKPSVSNVSISPISPGISDTLKISYMPSSDSVKETIRWFKNGEYQTSLDNSTIVPNDHISYNDTWYAEVTPEDLIEKGNTEKSNSVLVSKSSPLLSKISILPNSPTVNDILEASYQYSDSLLSIDNSSINWFINGVENTSFANKKFIKYSFNEGDKVSFSVVPSDGIFSGVKLYSDEVKILADNFYIKELRVDNVENNINVESDSPVISWDYYSPSGLYQKVVNIKVGTAVSLDDVFSANIYQTTNSYILNNINFIPGRDYYISVQVGYDKNNMSEKYYSKFRLKGSLWSSSVNNSTGWSFLSSLKIDKSSDTSVYSSISINDGSYSCEVRIYSAKIVFLSGQTKIIADYDFSSIYNNLLIIGSKNDVKIYINNKIIINGIGSMVQETIDKSIDINSMSSLLNIKYIYLSVAGAFEPGVSKEYSNFNFKKYFDLSGEEVVDIKELGESFYIASNDIVYNNSSSIYKVELDKNYNKFECENINNNTVTIKSISESPDKKYTVFSHSSGVSYMYSIPISNWNVINNFSVNQNIGDWEKIQWGKEDCFSFSSDGLIIDSTIEGSADVDPYNPYSLVSPSKCYITQRSIGSQWVDMADNSNGWTIDLDMYIPYLEPISTSQRETEDGVGIYINDGSYQETINIFPQEFYITSKNLGFKTNNTNKSKYRITGKDNSLKIYVKSSSDQKYKLISNSIFDKKAYSSFNAKNPDICYGEDDFLHATWEEDYQSSKAVFYSEFNPILKEWSYPVIVANNAQNPKISFDTLNKIVYVIYEYKKDSLSGIGITTKIETEIGLPHFIHYGKGESFNPSMTIDSLGNLHAVWEELFIDKSSIMYATRDIKTAKWSTDESGHSLISLSPSTSFCKNPSITTYKNNIYVSWTEKDISNNQQIFLTYFDYSLSTWRSSPLSVSSPINKGDFSNIVSDSFGKIHVAWTELDSSKNYQINHIDLSSTFSSVSNKYQVTNTGKNSIRPKLSISSLTGDVYVTYYKYEDTIDSNSSYYKKYSVFFSRYSQSRKVWESSSGGYSYGSYTLGNFDIKITGKTDRNSYSPSVPTYFSTEIPIIYHAEVYSSSGDYLNNNKLYSSVYFGFLTSAAYDYLASGLQYSNEVSFSIASSSTYEYGASEYILNKNRSTKEIRIGDFSNNYGSKIIIQRVGYYTGGEIEPYDISLIYPFSGFSANCSVINNNGDSWIGTDNGLYFYNKNSGSFFKLDDANSGVSNLKINDIIIDVYGNMILGTDLGIYISNDHYYFTRINSDLLKLNSKDIPITSLACDSSFNLYAGTNHHGISSYSGPGLFVLSLSQLSNELKITKNNYNKERKSPGTFDLDSTSIKQVYFGSELKNTVNKIKIDEFGVLWIATNDGLVRYKDGKYFVYSTQDGIFSSKINDIAIRNNTIRYISTSNKIYKMIGSNFEVITGENSISSRITSPSLSIWKNPDVLFTVSGSNIDQISFKYEDVVNYKQSVSRITAENYALVKTTKTDYDTFRLVGDTSSVNKDSLVEVYINGRKISRGYSYDLSGYYKTIKFNVSILETDIVDVYVRNDIVKIIDLGISKAEQKVIGEKKINTSAIDIYNNNIFSLNYGDKNIIQSFDLETSYSLPYDRVILDTIPPKGKISFNKQISNKIVNLKISQISDSSGVLLPYDVTSGIDSMIVSNYENFTSDGFTKLTSVPFSENINHDIGILFNNNIVDMSFSGCEGYRICALNINSNYDVYVGSKSPAKIFKYNYSTSSYDMLKDFSSSGSNTYIGFMINYFNYVYFSVCNLNSGGSDIYSTQDGSTYNYIGNIPESICDTAEIVNSVLYFASSSPGNIYAYNNAKISKIFSSVASNIYSMSGYNSYLYVSSGNEGKVFKFDTNTLNYEIIHTDHDSSITSVLASKISNRDIVLIGTGSTGKIYRSYIPESPFIKSFQTSQSKVNFIKNVGTVVYASIEDTLYYFDKAWISKYKHNEPILDITKDVNGDVLIVSKSNIYKISDIKSSRKIYLKLIDKAGNETDIHTSPDVLDPNLYTELNIFNLSGYINKNRIIEINELATTVFSYDGDSSFYSANKVVDDYGEYYSEIFNGTNSFVSWSEISWTGNQPNNTSIKFYIRSGLTKDDLLSSKFETVLTYSESGYDISYLTGQFIQFKIVMSSGTRGISPSISRVTIKSVASNSTHFFTTNFVLPSRLKSGIITSQKMIPVSADVVFGINANNSTDFSDYQIVDENRIFTTNGKQTGDNLRVGIKLITPNTGSYYPYDYTEYAYSGSEIQYNSLVWKYKNETGAQLVVNFKVDFYTDFLMTTKVFSADSYNDLGFYFNKDVQSSGSIVLDINEEVFVTYSPTGNTPIVCGKEYYCVINTYNSSSFTSSSAGHVFMSTCQIDYIDYIYFRFINNSSSKYFNFRIRFYLDKEKTNLYKTVFSGNDQSGWTSNGSSITHLGTHINAGSPANIYYYPSVLDFDSTKVYYIAVDFYDGTDFKPIFDDFTFKVISHSYATYCAPYGDVPIVNNFAISFDLEGNEIIILNVKG